MARNSMFIPQIKIGAGAGELGDRVLLTTSKSQGLGSSEIESCLPRESPWVLSPAQKIRGGKRAQVS